MSVPHGLDGSVIRLTDPSRSGIIPISRTDGGLPDVDPSNTIIVRPLTAVVQAGRNELRQQPMTTHRGNKDKRQSLVLCESMQFLSIFSLLPVHRSVFTLTSSICHLLSSRFSISPQPKLQSVVVIVIVSGLGCGLSVVQYCALNHCLIKCSLTACLLPSTTTKTAHHPLLQTLSTIASTPSTRWQHLLPRRVALAPNVRRRGCSLYPLTPLLALLPLDTDTSPAL